MKAILIIEKAPKSCDECELMAEYVEDQARCYITCIPTKNDKAKKQCPLIEINDNIAKLIEVAR